jgi:hypothetical protein
MHTWQMLLQSSWTNWQNQRQPSVVAAAVSATDRWRYDQIDPNSPAANSLDDK